MDKLSMEVLKELLPEEREIIAPKPKLRGPRADHYTPAILLERAAYLRKMAKHGDGSAGETLKEYPQHCTMLSFRSRSGTPRCMSASLTCFTSLRAAPRSSPVVPWWVRAPFRRERCAENGRGRRSAGTACRRCGACPRWAASSNAGAGRQDFHRLRDQDPGDA